MEGTQPSYNQINTHQYIQGISAMHEQSTDNIQFAGQGGQENGGDADTGDNHKNPYRVQRTQLTKLQPAGGSSMAVADPKPDDMSAAQFEQIMERDSAH